MRKNKKKPTFDHGVERTSVPTRQPQQGPFPLIQAPAKACIMQNTQAYEVSSNGRPFGLPAYTVVDEYGRVYTPNMRYGPQPNSGPVPIPTPSTVVQLSTIYAPVEFPQNTPARPENE